MTAYLQRCERNLKKTGAYQAYHNIALLSTSPPITAIRVTTGNHNGNTLRNGVHRIAVQITSLLPTTIRAMLSNREKTLIDILLEILARSVHPLMSLVTMHTAGLPPVIETAGHIQAIGIGLQSRVNPRTLRHHPATHSTRRPIRTRPPLLILSAPALHLKPLMYHHHLHHHHLNAQSRHLCKVSSPQQTFMSYLVLAEAPQQRISRKRIVL